MDIKGNSLYAQMQTMALQATQATQATQSTQVTPTNHEAAGIQPVNKSGSNFGQLLQDAVGKVNELQMDTGAKRKAFELGDDSVTLADTMIASSKSGLAFDATVQVRNKFVEAYKEIMSMPV